MDWDWPWWLMFLAAMLSSYLRELQLRKERNDPRCTLFYTYQPPPQPHAPQGLHGRPGRASGAREQARAGDIPSG